VLMDGEPGGVSFVGELIRLRLADAEMTGGLLRGEPGFGLVLFSTLGFEAWCEELGEGVEVLIIKLGDECADEAHETTSRCGTRSPFVGVSLDPCPVFRVPIGGDMGHGPLHRVRDTVGTRSVGALVSSLYGLSE